MRSILVNTITWILIACGAFFFVRGGLDYWESKSAQDAIAAEWNRETAESASLPRGHWDAPRGSAAPSNSRGETPNASSALETVTPRAGSAMARLSIPRLDAVLYVVEGDDTRDLKRGPGHLTGTAMPGQDGNCVIAGHRDTHFRVLKDIRKGDEILVSRNGQTFHYVVDEMSIVSPDNLAPLEPSHTPVLNLITCYPFFYVGSAPRRFIVHARLENEPLRASR
ncbi:MAG TPA: class D sortase [Bryobacteraceae bacterium]|nr:class D sortase [Bryobacteraceae bacterium]